MGVSPDDQETSDRFRKSLDLPFPLFGDPERRVIDAYGVRWPFLGRPKRVTYVVGRDRKVRLAFHSELRLEGHAARACQVARA